MRVVRLQKKRLAYVVTLDNLVFEEFKKEHVLVLICQGFTY